MTQYIVVSSPLKYGRLVTKTKVLISVVVIYLYSATFWCLHLMGVSPYVQSIIDLFLHMYILVLVTIAIYMLLHHTMKKKMAAANSLQGQTGAQDSGKHVQVQRNFVRVNFMLLAVLIVCSAPAAVLWTVRLFIDDAYAPSAKTLIANLMTDNLLYLKFLLDPFVYAWRMPRYRESLSKILCRKNISRQSSRKGNENKSVTVGARRDSELSAEELNRSVMTLLSFKNTAGSSVPIT
ncbi:hypothetical protein OS493_032077 [Desmophyllum pertusum]|uniref:G-protein coupled receptors family 1 profile domain-containing protein n=1 Tax=Desmophyllum pertusum TaxID=174260 RepID=A0A9W9YMP5_9CNID|nr:hypothetical protein OS493_032077 [Desmophyllum pertusum]